MSKIMPKCQSCKAEFNITDEDKVFYKKIDVPEPTWCPECRLIRRLNWRNETNLYRRKCDFSGKDIFSAFSPESSVKVYERKLWWSDQWDPMEYSQDYSYTKTFFEQFNELLKKVPLPSLNIEGEMVNSDHCMNSGYMKNCYLLFGSAFDEDCAYGIAVEYSKDSYDNSHVEKCELCHQGFMLNNCYRTFFSSHCDDCQEVSFCHNCVSCSNCLGCTNLRHKKYYIFNKQHTKEEYKKKLEEFNLSSFQSIQELGEKAKKQHLQYPVKFMTGRKNNDVTGDYIYNSKNVKDSFHVKNGENLRYCYNARYEPGVQDCHDYSIWGWNAQLLYEVVASGSGLNNTKFCSYCYDNSHNIEYSYDCHSSSDLFGCVGLRKKQYCILNKQYTKEEYEELIPKIKKFMNDMPYTDKKGRVYKYGEFFPSEFSPFAYNETIAYEYFPLTKEQTIEKGYTWYNKPKSEHKPTIKASDLPDDIKDVDKDILKEVIECSHNDCAGSSVYRIIPNEFEFYKKQNLPLPRLCPDCRHKERMKQRTPLKLWHRKCMKEGCDVKFETSYAPDRPEIVYCEKCYLEEVG